MAIFPADGSSAGTLIGAARSRLRGPPPGEGPLPAADRLALLPAGIVLVDPLMNQVFKRAECAAHAQISVLVVGETGTGKEVVAEAIHG